MDGRPSHSFPLKDIVCLLSQTYTLFLCFNIRSCIFFPHIFFKTIYTCTTDIAESNNLKSIGTEYLVF